jgi:hypothetical protein
MLFLFMGDSGLSTDNYSEKSMYWEKNDKCYGKSMILKKVYDYLL